MLEMLSNLDIEWFFGIIITIALFHFQKLANTEFHKRKDIDSKIENIFSKIHNIEKDQNLSNKEKDFTKESFENIWQNISDIRKEISTKIYDVEVKTYKIRGEILHNYENFRTEQNDILEKLDSKIENIYQLLITQNESKKKNK